MTIDMSGKTDVQRIQRYLKNFDFKSLFVEELGWDILKEGSLLITVGSETYTLRPLVEKRGVNVYISDPNQQGKIADDATLRKIEREVTKLAAYEHILIFQDKALENQVWQWVKREQGKPLSFYQHHWHKNQSGESLAQKLQKLAVDINEEAELGTASVAERVREAFHKERVTKKFYDRFKVEHARFLAFIQGITEQANREWYASLMLNRLMFVYFIQRKGFLDTKSPGKLDGDTNYLPNRLRRMQEQYPPNDEGKQDTFYSFYRYFLLKLFHDGLSKREHSPELEKLLGKVPYLNGGLFDVHELERDNPSITIPDEAFVRLFAFFDEFQWHLDDRPLKKDNEINPDVLGYIFEKYINQKQMGAYYTKEDITDYIGKNTIIPYLFDAAEQKCLVAFEVNGPVWSLLRDNPDRYIYDAVKKGCDLPLPPTIEAGIADVARRGEWNRPAPEEYALPTEIWREVVARRQRYTEVKAKLAAGEIHSINDLITYNLDMRQFAQDAIMYCEGTNLLRAFYDSIEQVTVLDPTCGSGAFLFAALNILEPLYEACLDRMQTMVAERDLLDASIKPEQRINRPDITRFRNILAQVAKHPNRAYFILKSIIINNLYGVDIMEEATEICKLRLFLKLVSQVQQFNDIEPLPDIDFNIRAGNTLVGFATYAEAERAITSKFDFDNTMERIAQKAKEIERSFASFRALQTTLQIDSEAMAAMKQQIREQLKVLNTELHGYLASEYGIDQKNKPKKEDYEKAFKAWEKSHQPFHWFIEFYRIMQDGGFDVIIGNPPYVEYSKVKGDYTIKGYQTESCGNLYAFVMERSLSLQSWSIKGRSGMIVPAGLLGLDEVLSLREVLKQNISEHWFSTFAIRPSKLFDGVDQRLCINIAARERNKNIFMFTTDYHHWYVEERLALFSLLTYQPSNNYSALDRIPQIGSIEAQGVFSKLQKRQKKCVIHFYSSGRTGYLMHYHRSPRYWIRGMDFEQYFKSETRARSVHHFRDLHFKAELESKFIGALLNSSLFFFWFVSIGNGRNITGIDIEQFPIGDISEAVLKEMVTLFDSLMEDYKRYSVLRIRQDCEFQEFRPSKSKPIIDEIDRVLAQHYGFTDEELDFIINYDIKYRMGKYSGDEGEE